MEINELKKEQRPISNNSVTPYFTGDVLRLTVVV
jgi:hypothetical protein